MVTFTDKDVMPGSGKYAGHKLANIPAEYFLWLLENNKCFGPVKKYIIDNKEHLELEAKQDRKIRNK